VGKKVGQVVLVTLSIDTDKLQNLIKMGFSVKKIASDISKDGYVSDSLYHRLEVTKLLGL